MNDDRIDLLTEKIIEIEKEAMARHMESNNNALYSNKSKINDRTVNSIIKALNEVCGEVENDHKKD